MYFPEWVLDLHFASPVALWGSTSVKKAAKVLPKASNMSPKVAPKRNFLISVESLKLAPLTHENILFHLCGGPFVAPSRTKSVTQSPDTKTSTQKCFGGTFGIHGRPPGRIQCEFGLKKGLLF